MAQELTPEELKSLFLSFNQTEEIFKAQKPCKPVQHSFLSPYEIETLSGFFKSLAQGFEEFLKNLDSQEIRFGFLGFNQHHFEPGTKIRVLDLGIWGVYLVAASGLSEDRVLALAGFLGGIFQTHVCLLPRDSEGVKESSLARFCFVWQQQNFSLELSLFLGREEAKKLVAHLEE